MKQNFLSSPRLLLVIMFMLCGGVIVLSLLMLKNSPPCPLCEISVIILAILCIISMIGTIHGSQAKNRTLYGPLLFVLAIFGTVIALRLIWLQNHPGTQACSLGGLYLLQALSLKKALATIWLSGGICDPQQIRFLGCTIAQWLATCFPLTMLISLGIIAKPK